jgi:TonB family protein
VVFVVLFVIAFVISPLLRRPEVRVILPEQVVILPEPRAERPRQEVAMRQVADAPVALPDHFSLPAPRVHRDDPSHVVDSEADRIGRERAQKVTAELASSTGALDRALRDLQSSLRDSKSGEYEPSRRARTRTVGGGRSDGDLPAVASGSASAGSADLKGSTVQGTMVGIGTLTPASAEAGAPADDSGPSAGSAPGVYRSNASLLAVIRKYAAGIQFCYDSELKRDPGLKGKLVVALTISAAGQVTEARVIQNTLGSDRLASCALSQIRDWRFPAIPKGVTTFQAPFVFTPPN